MTPGLFFRSRTMRYLILLVMLCSLAGPVVADDDPALDVRALATWQGREVAALELVGMPEGLVDKARKGLALTPRRKLLRLQRPRLRMSLAESDARRLQLLLARHGYPAATITAAGELDDEHVRVVFTVDRGAPMSIGDVDAPGLPAMATTALDSVRLDLARGRRFTDAAVAGARDELLLAVQRAGHARPEITSRLVRAATDTVDVVFDCVPGPTFRYRQFVQNGTPEDLVTLVDRTVDLTPDTPFAPAVARHARRDLRELQLFRQVRLRSEAVSDTTLDLVASLQPRAMTTLEVSVGSFTDDWLVASGGIKHRNLFGGGRGGQTGALYSIHRREALAGVWWPALVARRSRTELELRGKIEDEDAYELRTVAIELATLFRVGSSSSIRVSGEVSNGELENRSADADAFQSDVGLLTVLGAKFYRDTSDNPIDPRTGSRLTMQGEISPPGAWTDTPFAAVRVYGSRYLPIGGENTVAVRLDGAVGWPLGDAVDLRPDRRYFAGGVSTMRGYGRRELGPVDAEGQPVGGQVRVLAGAEYRLALTKLFGVAVFVDGGQVWRERDDLDLGELAVAAGAGLLIRTPIGPVRLDVAYNVTTPERDLGRTNLSFAIGHPY